LIKNLSILPNATINIFNRFGKLLKQFNSSSQGWNGIFNGASLPADDYWFTLKAEDRKIIKGHFSLKR
jgi:gliding motility-associated-like protein